MSESELTLEQTATLLIKEPEKLRCQIQGGLNPSRRYNALNSSKRISVSEMRNSKKALPYGNPPKHLVSIQDYINKLNFSIPTQTDSHRLPHQNSYNHHEGSTNSLELIPSMNLTTNKLSANLSKYRWVMIFENYNFSTFNFFFATTKNQINSKNTLFKQFFFII